MPSTSLPPITESQILTSYLLPPSPLPTILPYPAFLNLIPQSYRNNPAHASTLRRLYRDLQFQRLITIDQVRENIEREASGEKAAGLRARLTRQISIEEGSRRAEREERRERKRREREIVRRNAALDESDADENDEDVDEDEEMASDYDEFNDSLQMAVNQAMYDHPDSLHPAAHVLPTPAGLDGGTMEDVSRFHTKESLLVAMENANESLDQEIEELEAQCAELREGIGENVSALSDLRYGKRQSGGGTSDDQFKDVLEAIEQFREVVRTRQGL